jgi:hypothetical protein
MSWEKPERFLTAFSFRVGRRGFVRCIPSTEQRTKGRYLGGGFPGEKCIGALIVF